MTELPARPARPLPVLGLLVDRPPPPAVVPVLAALRPWCRPLAVGGVGPVRAWFATSLRSVPDDGRPVAVWVDAVDELGAHAGALRRATVVLSDDPDVVGAVGDRGILTAPRVDTREMLPITPFVRARMRQRLGLGECLVVAVGDEAGHVEGGGQLAPDLRDTALMLASAAAVTGSSLLRALTWGTPTVTDEASAAAVGAAHGREVVVAEPDGLLEAARTLAGDEDAAARIGRLARRLVERRHDVAAVVDRLRAELLRGDENGWTAVWHRLDELRTPLRAPIRMRAAQAVAGLAGTEGP